MRWSRRCSGRWSVLGATDIRDYSVLSILNSIRMPIHTTIVLRFVNLMHLHIQSNPELLAPPLDSSATVESPKPDRKRQALSTDPCQQPLSENTLLACTRPPGEGWGVLVHFDGRSGMKQLVLHSVGEAPDGNTQKPEECKGAPGLRYAEGIMEER